MCCKSELLLGQSANFAQILLLSHLVVVIVFPLVELSLHCVFSFYIASEDIDNPSQPKL